MKNVLPYLFHLSLKAILILTSIVVVVTVVQYLVVSAKIKLRFKVLYIYLVHVGVWAFFVLFFKYNPYLHLGIFSVSVVITALLYLLTVPISFEKKEIKDKNFRIPFPTRNGADFVIENAKRSVLILGSNGSGKTVSIFVPIIAFLCKNNLPFFIYDLKNGELSEIANFFLQNSTLNKYVIAPHNPLISDQINPFEPIYIPTEQHLRQKTKLIFANLKKAEGVKDASISSFFDKIPEPTLAAVIWRLKEDFPEYCTLPHAVAFCIRRSPVDIAKFVSKNTYARVIGSPLFDSIASEDQVAGVKASLSLALTDLAVPAMFWIMKKSTVKLNINNPKNPASFALINNPQLDKSNAPFVSVITASVINAMQERNMLPSYIVMDEAITFELDGISKIPATMRSYDIATIWSTQDIALAEEYLGRETTRALLSNLNYQFIGKANDPLSIKHYKEISEEIEKTTISKSYKDAFIKGDTRTSEGTRETSKHKNQDFTRLKEGEFFVFADGKDELVKFDLIPFQRIENKVKHFITNADIQQNFDDIIETMESFPV